MPTANSSPAKRRTVASKKPVSPITKPVKAAAKKPSSRAKSAKPPVGIAPEQRANYIEVAAYYIAERRGFAPGDPLADWIEAEAEVDRMLASGHLGA